MRQMDYHELPEIPAEFYNSDTGVPFTECMVCQCDLIQEQEPYAVERAIRHYPELELDNVVFEYALCARCVGDMEREISKKTMLAIMGYFREHISYGQRPTWNPEDAEHAVFNCEEWTGHCAVKGMPRKELFEYSLHARCIGDRIIPEVIPYMISGQAQDDLVGLFSNASLGFLDDFTDRHFSGPPELKELFKGRPILV